MTTLDFTEAEWQKSSRTTGGGNCVEVAQVKKIVGVRDTKLKRESPILSFDKNEWISFLDAIKSGCANFH